MEEEKVSLHITDDTVLAQEKGEMSRQRRRWLDRKAQKRAFAELKAETIKNRRKKNTANV